MVAAVSYCIKVPGMTALATDDEGVLHLEQIFSSMFFLLTTMVGRDNDDRIIIDASSLERLDKAADERVKVSKRLVVFRRVVTDGMPRMVKLIPTNGEERGVLLGDELLRHSA